MHRRHPSSCPRMRYSIVAVFAVAAAAGASGSCLFGTTTNLCEADGIRCRSGHTCAAAQRVCIKIGGCGDGVVSGDEVCDDGNIESGDGCSFDCSTTESCLNGIADPGEDCDSGSAGDSAVCDADCTAVRCGDGHVNSMAGEACDNPGAVSSRDCNGPLCTRPRCGDGFFNPMADEECDTGAADTKACNGTIPEHGDPASSCKVPRCGDGYVNRELTLPAPLVDVKEECDSRRVDTAGCDRDCTFPQCGDGIVNRAANEECEEGAVNTRTCDRDCTKPVCGDRLINAAAGELCDDGNTSTNDACPSGPAGSCKPAICGDGFVQAGVEECDPPGAPCAGVKLCENGCVCR